MTRKQLIEQQFKEELCQYEAGQLTLDPNDALPEWPLHKLAVYIYLDKDCGREWLEVLLEHFSQSPAGFRYELLADNAVELERRHFPHVAEVLWKVAENAKSEVDDCIERDEAERLRRQRDGHRDRGYWYLSQWLRSRARTTGQSGAELIAFYGLQDWFEIPATNGAERVH